MKFSKLFADYPPKSSRKGGLNTKQPARAVDTPSCPKDSFGGGRVSAE